MNISFSFKKLIIAMALVTMGVVIFLVHTLAGLSARPVVFADPPALVERYAAEMDHSDPSSLPKEPETGARRAVETEFAKFTTDLSEEETFVFKVILGGEALDGLLRLFAHPEKAQRVKVAAAFAAVNVKFTHNEESGFSEKKGQFWANAKEHLPNIQNALFEALIASAEEGTTTYIPYTLAWMPGQDRETLEVLTWATKHHPDPWVRWFSVHFVVKYGGHEDLAGPLLRNRTHDPNYGVRKEVLELRVSRFKQMLGMAEDT